MAGMEPTSKGWPGYDKPRTPQQLQADINALADKHRILAGSVDLLQARSSRHEKMLQLERNLRWVLAGALVLSWAVLYGVLR
jgi:hypothetical protein